MDSKYKTFQVEPWKEKPWPKSRLGRQKFIMEAIIEGDCALDRLMQLVGVDDFRGISQMTVQAFEKATENGEVNPHEWTNVCKLARLALEDMRRK